MSGRALKNLNLWLKTEFLASFTSWDKLVSALHPPYKPCNRKRQFVYAKLKESIVWKCKPSLVTLIFV